MSLLLVFTNNSTKNVFEILFYLLSDRAPSLQNGVTHVALWHSWLERKNFWIYFWVGFLYLSIKNESKNTFLVKIRNIQWKKNVSSRYGICCGIKNDLLVEPSYVQEGVDLLLRCLGWSFFELYRFQDLERLSLEKMCPEKEILSTSRIHLDLVSVRPFRRKSSNTWRIASRWLCWASAGVLLHPQTTLQIPWRSLHRVSRKSVDNGVAT